MDPARFTRIDGVTWRIEPTGAMRVPAGISVSFARMTIPSLTNHLSVSKSVPRGNGRMTTPSPRHTFLSRMAPSMSQFCPTPISGA